MSNDKRQKILWKKSVVRCLLTVDKLLIMKKSLLLTLALLLTTAIFSQDRTYIVNESFDSATLPYGWEVAGEGAENFDIKTTNNAGGDPNELHLKSSPFITSGIHLIMAWADLDGIESVELSFKHYLSNYQQSSTIGIATSSDNGITWNTAWSQTYSQSGQYTINETITSADMGKTNVLFCLFFEGNTYNIDHWYFDDIIIFSQGGNETELSLFNIDIDSRIPSEPVEIGFGVSNSGNVDITSFEMSYYIHGDSIVTLSETFNETIYVNTGMQQFTFSEPIELLPGSYTIMMSVTAINGEEYSSQFATSFKDFKVYMKTVQRTPMIEHFSSSTCQPCVNVDNEMATLTENNPGKYTYTKYPMNMPYMGDPYFIDECLVRADYYGIEGVPRIALDGSTQSASISQTQLDERLNVTSYVDIAGAFQTNGNIMNLTADIMSYIDLYNVKVFITINEKTTHDNASTNGLDEFHHVIMKMLGSNTGIATDFLAGQSQRFEFSVDMSETNVEEMEDLEVAVWIQDYESKDIYNSCFLNEYTEHPYPARNVTIENSVISWDTPENGNPSGYNVYINNELAAENVTNLSYEANGTTIRFAEVFALYDETTSIGATSLTSPSCDSPTNLNATIEQNVEGFDYNFKVTMSWIEVNAAQQYRLYLDGELLETLTDNTFVKGFDEEGEHYFTVTSVCENGESEQSETFGFELIGVSVEESLSEDVEIYPNPARDFVKLSAISCQLSAIRVYNYLGILIEEIEINSDEVEINVSEYNSGIYFISIQTENGNLIKKFIKN